MEGSPGHQEEAGNPVVAGILVVVHLGIQVVVQNREALRLVVLPCLQSPVVHLPGNRLVETRETLLAALVLPHPPPAHSIQQATLVLQAD